MNTSDKLRFEAKTKADPSGCIVWTACRSTGGYGFFWDIDLKKNVYAHRAAWNIYKSPIPKGLYVLHKCDNPACVNPDHLFLGTLQDNSRDRNSKGRNVNTRGENNGKCKLTVNKVLEIKAKLSSGYRNKDLGTEYGVSVNTISSIKRKINWAFV